MKIKDLKEHDYEVIRLYQRIIYKIDNPKFEGWNFEELKFFNRLNKRKEKK